MVFFSSFSSFSESISTIALYVLPIHRTTYLVKKGFYSVSGILISSTVRSYLANLYVFESISKDFWSFSLPFLLLLSFISTIPIYYLVNKVLQWFLSTYLTDLYFLGFHSCLLESNLRFLDIHISHNKKARKHLLIELSHPPSTTSQD